MTTTINADNVTGGAVVTADASGVLELQSSGTTAMTFNGANSTAAGNLTVTGTTTASSNLAFSAQYTENVYSLTGTALDPANGTIQTKTLAGNTTLTDSVGAGESMILMINGGATYTVTWPTMTWSGSGGNVAPTLTANDVVVLWKVSTTLYGSYAGSYA